jgi:hypothetical protein
MKLADYDKVSEIWLLLNQVEQYMINDPTYQNVITKITTSLDLVETIQHKIEASGQ